MRRGNTPMGATSGGRSDWNGWWIALPAVAGALWGVLCWLGDGFPPPFSAFFNLGAPWLLLAWLIGYRFGSNPRGAICGGLALAAGIIAYYAVYTSGISVGGQAARVYDPAARGWLLLAALSGPVFGAAGAWCRNPNQWFRIGGVTLIAGALLAEVAYYLHTVVIVHESSPFFDPGEPRLVTIAGYVLPSNGGVFVLAVQSAVALACLPLVLSSRRDLALGFGAIAALTGLGILALDFVYQLIRGY